MVFGLKFSPDTWQLVKHMYLTTYNSVQIFTA